MPARPSLSPLVRASIRLASTFVADTCIAAVDSLGRLTGTTAIKSGTPFEPCCRDIHAAGAHVQVQDIHWETAGRGLLGLDPGKEAFSCIEWNDD